MRTENDRALFIYSDASSSHSSMSSCRGRARLELLTSRVKVDREIRSTPTNASGLGNFPDVAAVGAGRDDAKRSGRENDGFSTLAASCLPE